MTRIKLRKVYFAACYDFNTGRIIYPAKFYTGYIVTGLYGSGDFYIPKTYAGLNIIGITWQAYTTLPEYKTGSTRYPYESCYPSLYFHNETMLFIMYPKRNSETTRVYPLYYVDTVNGCYRYNVSAMTYNQNDSLLKYVVESFLTPYNAGYSCKGSLEIDKWQGSKHYTARPAIGMYSSSSSLDDHKMGLNYFECPYFEWNEVRDVMQRNKVVAAHCRIGNQTPSSPNQVIPFAYNIVNGFDVEIDSSRPDDYSSKYYLQNQ